MVKQGEKPHSKNGISIQNTRTLTQGQMKIRIFTGLASSLQSVQRKKVRTARFAFKFRFIEDECYYAFSNSKFS